MNTKDFIKTFYKKGRLFKIPVYPETTMDKEIGKKFADGRILFKINTPKGTKAIYMENLGTTQAGRYENEEEVLLPRNLTYRFKDYTETNNCHVIELDIVPQKPFLKKVHEFWNEVRPKYWE